MSNKKVIGIDLGGTSAKIGILNTSGEIDLKWSIDTDISDEGSKIVPNIIKSLKEKMKEQSYQSNDNRTQAEILEKVRKILDKGGAVSGDI